MSFGFNYIFTYFVLKMRVLKSMLESYKFESARWFQATTTETFEQLS